MFTLEGVIAAPSSSEATARYWAWRASQAGSPEAEQLLRSKMHRADPAGGDATSLRNLEQEILADRMVANHGRPSTEAGRLAIYHALYADLALGLQETPQRRDGVLYQTDYVPIGRMATALTGLNTNGLPTKTLTSTHTEFAYVKEQGQPLTVIHGDFVVAQTHLVEVHQFAPTDIVPLRAPVV